MIVGIKEAAVLIARETGLCDVAPADVRALAERGLVRVVVPGDWPLLELDVSTGGLLRVDGPGCGWPLVKLDRAARLDLPAGLADELRQIIQGRQQWWAASVSRSDAAEALGMTPSTFDALVARYGVEPGRFRRYARSDVERLRQLTLAPMQGVRQELAG